MDIGGPFDIPFKSFCDDFFYKRGRCYMTNASRKISRQSREIENQDGVTVTKFPVPPEASESFSSALAHLERILRSCDSKRQRSIVGCTAVLEHMKRTSSVFAVQDLVEIYQKAVANHRQEESTSKRMGSYELQERFRDNGIEIIIFYMYGHAFTVFPKTSSIGKVVEQFQKALPVDVLVNEQIKSKLGSIYNDSLEMLTSKTDKDIVKSLFATATSARFTAKLQGIKNPTAISRNKHQHHFRVEEYKNLKITSHLVRNDMTTKQLAKLRNLILTMKLKDMYCLPFENRGRELSIETFPELTSILERVFEAGGMESHPRLTTSTLFRAEKNNLFMHQARECILMHAPSHFKVSLSTCYNYTMNYRENSRAAIQHHHGRGINADISLKRPPRANSRKVLNLHWSASNVKLFLANSNVKETMIDSKDAKALVYGDITPVQKPGKSWRKINAPDHDWDQSKTYAVTPMTHLFLETKEHETIEVDVGSEKRNQTTITRGGKACTFINISYFESDNTFRRFNEIFKLMENPGLDSKFRSTFTDRLKPNFSFIVDNGPGEAPSSWLVRMLLVRLLNYFNLDSVAQLSFAEYNSKMNFVERVHTKENLCLYAHGPFDTKTVHQNFKVGDEKHKANMEAMATEVVNCISQGKYSDHPISTFRGIKDEEYVFDDEEKLRQFLLLSEEGKAECDWSYMPKDVPLNTAMTLTWNANGSTERRYIDDYKYLTSSQPSQPRTNWMDKYSCVVYRESDQDGKLDRFQPQPIPDFLRWFETEELHYLSIERTKEVIKAIKDLSILPELFLPTKILDTVLRITEEIPEDVLQTLSLICCVTPNEFKHAIGEKNEKLKTTIEDGIEQERYRKHALYKEKRCVLEEKCKMEKIAYKNLKKHELVKALLKDETLPQYIPRRLKDLPTTLYKIASDVPVADLRHILKQHGLSTMGTKDELAMRCYLKIHGKEDYISRNEVQYLMKVIDIAKEVVLQEKRLLLIRFQDTLTVRKFQTGFEKSMLKKLEGTDLEEIFLPLELFLKAYISPEIRTNAEDFSCEEGAEDEECNPYERFFQVGTKVKVLWEKDAVANLGWRGGWYVAYVTDFCREEDEISIQHVSERGQIYTIEVTSALDANELKLA
ncbi:uncharacterized protein [Clytia hemisphaerica]|uniref:uncharacterized protein n=1 Tax=Clytia hemisphaerica TaxID=252671 RepID=UPI0034D752A9